ncbi:hypothetical protein FRC0475_00106 [Corynebacterium diphtheriae]|nr:hypothetical protein FRC0475_00106 [Corynebacterium diphtheriae]CAB0974362.1 hypothetical protein FRC0478_02231 [Corynebacterium diphtheriae]
MADHTPTTATPPGRVLVVDDEQPLAQMVASYLIRAGFDTRQAHTGTQAVDEARRFSPRCCGAGSGAARTRRPGGVPTDPHLLGLLHPHAHRAWQRGRQDQRFDPGGG